MDPRFVKDLRFLKDEAPLTLFLQRTLPALFGSERRPSDLTVLIDLVDDHTYRIDFGAGLVEVVGATSLLDQETPSLRIVAARADFERLLTERAQGVNATPPGVMISGQKGRMEQLLALLS